MSMINFIRSVPKQRKKEIRFWLLCTATICFSLLTAFAILMYVQIRVYTNLRNQKNSFKEQLANFDSIVAQQHKQKEEQVEMQQRLEKLNSCALNPSNPLEILQCVRTALGSFHLQSCRLKDNTLELTTECNQASQAIAIVNKLTQSKLVSNVKLVSLNSTHNNHLLCSIKGKIT